MRAFWIALLIALLPLRGWVGDAMAMSMLQTGHGPATLVSEAGAPCPHAGPAATAEAHAGTHSGTHSVAAAADHHGDAAHDPQAGSGHDHLVCDLCNGLALQAAAAEPARAHVSPGPQVQRIERFASRAPGRHHKPPIA